MLSRSGLAVEEYWCAAGRYANFAGAAHNVRLTRIPLPEGATPAWRFTFQDVGEAGLPSGLATIGATEERAVSASKAHGLCTIVRSRFPFLFFF